MIPKSLKTARIRTLLNKTGFDSDILKNVHPVSNFTFISKVIENVISGRLNEHAYRDKHTTVLIKVQNNIISALDAGSSAILLMLDYLLRSTQYITIYCYCHEYVLRYNWQCT